MELFGKNSDNDLIVIAEVGVNHNGNINLALNSNTFVLRYLNTKITVFLLLLRRI